jgi:hypothetical protein
MNERPEDFAKEEFDEQEFKPTSLRLRAATATVSRKSKSGWAKCSAPLMRPKRP